MADFAPPPSFPVLLAKLRLRTKIVEYGCRNYTLLSVLEGTVL